MRTLSIGWRYKFVFVLAVILTFVVGKNEAEVKGMNISIDPFTRYIHITYQEN